MILPCFATAAAAASAVSRSTLRSTLSWLDWAVIAGYFAIVAFVAWRASKGQNTASDYFLGSRNIGWFAIGGSLFASNIGSEHIVGLAGQGAASGLSMAHWELHAWALLMLGWVSLLLVLGLTRTAGGPFGRPAAPAGAAAAGVRPSGRRSTSRP